MLFASLPPARKRHTSALKSAGTAPARGGVTGLFAGSATAPITRSCARVDSMPVALTAAQHAPRNFRREVSGEKFLGFMGDDILSYIHGGTTSVSSANSRFE